MAITRSTGVFLGTDETTGITINNGVTATGAEIDLLGDNASNGSLNLYLSATSSNFAGGTIDVKLRYHRISGQAHDSVAKTVSVPPTNGTIKLYLGQYPVARYMACDVTNNSSGHSAATNVTVGYELFKVS
jgi:hypothetical protein